MTVLIATAVPAFLLGAFGSRAMLEVVSLETTQAAMAVVANIFWFTVVLCFAKIHSIQEFARGFALRRCDARHMLLATGSGCFLGLLVAVFLGQAVASGPLRFSINRVGVAALIGVFFEEPVMRGFFYRAFRNAYSVATSVALMAVIAFLLHPNTWRSLAVFGGITGMTVLTCLFRERTASLWPAVACHFAYNLVVSSVK